MFLVSVRLLCWLPPARTSQQLCLRAIPRTLAANKSAAAVDLLLQYPSAAVDLLLQQPYCCSRRIAAVALLCSRRTAAVKTAAFEYKYCFAGGKPAAAVKPRAAVKPASSGKPAAAVKPASAVTPSSAVYYCCNYLLLQLPTFCGRRSSFGVLHRLLEDLTTSSLCLFWRRVMMQTRVESVIKKYSNFVGVPIKLNGEVMFWRGYIRTVGFS